MSDEIWTIEINQDDDYASACAYHIDHFKKTSSRNLKVACEKRKTERWAIIGLAYSHDEAYDKVEKIRQELCKINERKPYGIVDLGSTIPLYIYTSGQTATQIQAIHEQIQAIQAEMKDFHGRLCAIEERNKK